LDAEIAALFHQCTGCGRCHTFCAHGNDVPTAMHLGRQLAAQAGLAPKSALDAADRVRHTGNVKGENLAQRQRELLGARVGAEVLEFFDRREASRSAGTGFGFERFDPATAKAIAARRVEDLPARADLVATSCPSCEAALRAVSPKPVVDVATLLARSLGLR